jgi:site-specific recombinase XerD
VLKSFLNNNDVGMSSINPSFLKKLEQHFSVLGWKPNTKSVYFRTLRSTINKAIIDRYLIKDKNPFNSYSISHMKNETVKRAISQQDIKNLEAQDTENPKERMAQNYFMFSYYCSGINFMDFAKIKVSQVSTLEGNTFLVYFRSKSKKLMNIQLVPQALAIFKRYSMDKEKDDYLFTVLDKETHIEPKTVYNRIYNIQGK